MSWVIKVVGCFMTWLLKCKGKEGTPPTFPDIGLKAWDYGRKLSILRISKTHNRAEADVAHQALPIYLYRHFWVAWPFRASKPAEGQEKFAHVFQAVNIVVSPVFLFFLFYFCIDLLETIYILVAFAGLLLTMLVTFMECWVIDPELVWRSGFWLNLLMNRRLVPPTFNQPILTLATHTHTHVASWWVSHQAEWLHICAPM